MDSSDDDSQLSSPCDDGEVHCCNVCGTQHKEGEDHQYDYVKEANIHRELLDAISQKPIDINGVQLPCEHMFSEKLLRRWILENDSCPICRDPVAVYDFKPLPRAIQNMLDDLRVRK